MELPPEIVADADTRLKINLEVRTVGEEWSPIIDQEVMKGEGAGMRVIAGGVKLIGNTQLIPDMENPIGLDIKEVAREGIGHDTQNLSGDKMRREGGIEMRERGILRSCTEAGTETEVLIDQVIDSVC